MVPANHPFSCCSPWKAWPGQRKAQKMGVGEHGGAGEGAANLRTVDLLEHLPHAIDIVVVEEPCLAVLLVLLERDGE